MDLTLGERIRLQRQRLKISQSEVARRMGIANNTLNLIEGGGTKDPRISQIIALARELDTHPNYLLGFDDDPRPPRRRRRSADAAADEDGDTEAEAPAWVALGDGWYGAPPVAVAE